jgi:deferrochelatase/peroxidase EfeB
MLRRGYNYVDGNDQLGRLSAGLFFIAFVTDPRTHYIPMQSRMSRSDLMQEYLQHIGSGLWAVPPGVREGEFVGQTLFDPAG